MLGKRAEISGESFQSGPGAQEPMVMVVRLLL